MRVLYVAEPVGKPGIFALKHTLAEIKTKLKPDFVLGSGDGATSGFGLGKNHAFYLHKLGLQAITMGDCAFFKKDIHPLYPTLGFLVRPANFPHPTPGRGWKIFEVSGKKVAVVSLLGQSGFSRIHLANPFHFLDSILEKVQKETPYVIVDFHAATSAEKNSFFFHANGRVSAVVGSHQKVPTADARVLGKGTAIITDAGRTGSRQSVSGFLASKEIARYKTGVLERSEECWDDLVVQCVLLEFDSEGKALSIQHHQINCKEVPHESTRNSDED